MSRNRQLKRLAEKAAPTLREQYQIIIAHERTALKSRGFIARLRHWFDHRPTRTELLLKQLNKLNTQPNEKANSSNPKKQRWQSRFISYIKEIFRPIER